MCYQEQWTFVNIVGRQYPRSRFVQTCEVPCPNPRVVQLNDQGYTRHQQQPPQEPQQPVAMPAVVIQPAAQASRTRRNSTPQPLRLEWRFPFGRKEKIPKKKKKTVVYVEQQAPQPQVLQVLTPPLTPVVVRPSPPRTPIVIQNDPVYEVIEPREVRHHERPTEAPPARRSRSQSRSRSRSSSRNRREREREEAAHRIETEQARIDARIRALRTELAAREAARDEERRTSARESRIRELETIIAAQEAEIAQEERRRRQAQPIVHHDGPRHQHHHRHHREERREERREPHERGFRTGRDDAGGGGARGSDGQRARRAREREIEELERQVNAGRRRRRRETLPPDVNGGRQQGNPFRERARDGLRSERVEAKGKRDEDRRR